MTRGKRNDGMPRAQQRRNPDGTRWLRGDSCHDCDEPVAVGGFCWKHRLTMCPLPWCNSHSRGGRFCHAHRRQMLRTLRVHCKVPNCPKRTAYNGYCQKHANRVAKHGTVNPLVEQWLPAEPLLGWLAANGGMKAVMQGHHYQSRQRDWSSKVVERARAQGVVRVDIADEFCCKALRVHPSQVWGEAWWLPEGEWDEAV